MTYRTQLTVWRMDGSAEWTVVDQTSNWGLGWTAPRPFHWSQDGRSLYFTDYGVPDGCPGFGNGWGLSKVDLADGSVIEVIPSMGNWMALSPEEGRLAYVPRTVHAVVIRDLDTAKESTFALGTGEGDPMASIGHILWSPDGSALILTIALDRCQALEKMRHSILRLDLSTGAETVLVDRDSRLLITQSWPRPDEVILLDGLERRWRMDANTGQTARAEDLALALPASCRVDDGETMLWVNPEDGYCLRFPDHFRLDDVYQRIANLYGPPLDKNMDPVRASVAILVEGVVGKPTLSEAVDEWLARRHLPPPEARHVSALGDELAEVVVYQGERSRGRAVFALHQNLLYVLAFHPVDERFPQAAPDVEAAWETVTGSFAFLSPVVREAYEARPPWRVPRLVFRRADHSLWASALDGGDPWPLTGPLTDTTDAIHWAPPVGGRWLAYIQATRWRTDRPAAWLHLLDLDTGARKTILGAMFPPDLERSDLPLDADVAVYYENTLVWHPDGMRLAFVSAHEGSADLYVYDRVRDQVQRVAGGVDNVFWPFWSPDDRFLLYFTTPRFDRGGNVPAGSAMWVIPAPGGDGTARRLTTGDRHELVLGWTDDHHLAALEQSGGAPSDLGLIDVTNGQRTLLFAGSIREATWSPPARLLAVVSETNERYGTGLWLVDPDAPDPVLLDGEHGLLSPRWSPQERYLIYGTGERCWLYDPQDGTVHDRPNTWCQGRWSPGDRYIAYAYGSVLEVIDVETGESRAITSYSVHSTRWSPDGEWLLWLRERDAREQRFDMLALRFGTGEPILVVEDVGVPVLWRLGWVQAGRGD